MRSEQPSRARPTIRELMVRQRRLAVCEDPLLRCFGTLLVSAVLEARLAEVSDRQIGQLMFDHFAPDLGIVQPEWTLCLQAIRRLFRSTGGKLTAQDVAQQRHRPCCPQCGEEMVLHYGVEEPDFYECGALDCQHRQYACRSEDEGTEEA